MRSVAGLPRGSTGDAEEPLYGDMAGRARLCAARAAIDELAAEVVLTARAECFLAEARPGWVVYRLRGRLPPRGDCLCAGHPDRGPDHDGRGAVVRAVNVMVGADAYGEH